MVLDARGIQFRPARFLRESMHREIRQADGCLEAESPRTLYFLTSVVAILIALDLFRFFPPLWLTYLGGKPEWFPGEIWGLRFALIAAVIGGARALYSALDSLTQGRPGADLAIAIAALAAIFLREHLVAAEVILVGLLGECLEWWTFERTKKELAGLFELCPDKCWRVLPGGESERIQTTEVRVGDRVGVKPGARVPVDGIIREGSGLFDTSALTGEGNPVEKGPGDEILAGYVNLQARIVMEAVRVAEHTIAGKIGEWTAQALKSKATLETTADRYARWFLPIVLALALGTLLVGLGYHWIFTRDLGGLRPPFADLLRRAAYPALGVLVVTCPCALILATPAAIIAAMGRLAGTGVLIKGGAALERLASVQAFAFDKTGTLTQGRLGFLEAVSWQGALTPDELLRLAGSVESGSDHPVARSILRELAKRGLQAPPVPDIEEVPGRGVRSGQGEAQVLVGSLRFLKEARQLEPDQEAWALELLGTRGASAVAVARGGRFAGMILAADEIRADAAAMVGPLRALDLSPLLILTGDNEKSARIVANAIGISDVYSGLLPQEKAEKIRELQKSGLKIGFIGDGVNDAVALASADAAIAVGRDGADIAAEVSDLVILGEPLGHLPFLIRLGRKTVEIIQQNILYYAFGLNILGILLTSWLWPWLVPANWESQSPIAAVIYHQIASIAVLVNAMRLLWFEKTSRAESFFSAMSPSVRGWDRYFDLDEWLHDIEHHFRKIVLGLAALAALYWGLSGVRFIKSGESGLVRRFGRLLDGTLEPGIHLRWPYPIEQVHVSQNDLARFVELGFRSRNPGGRSDPGATPDSGKIGEWTSSHLQDGILRYPEESLVVTGDGNLVEVFLTVRYRYAQPVEAELLAAGTEVQIRSHTESILRETLASTGADSLLGTARAGLAAHLREHLERRLRAQADFPTGLTIEDVAVHDLHPPREVVNSYHAVAKAMENGQKRVREAEALVLRRMSEEHARADRLTKMSEAERDSRIKLAQAKADGFLARLASRKGYEALVDFRLFWDTVGTALAGREKVLVDTWKDPARSLLWFVPPDFPRPPSASGGVPSGAPMGSAPGGLRNEP